MTNLRVAASDPPSPLSQYNMLAISGKSQGRHELMRNRTRRGAISLSAEGRDQVILSESKWLVCREEGADSIAVIRCNDKTSPSPQRIDESPETIAKQLAPRSTLNFRPI